MTEELRARVNKSIRKVTTDLNVINIIGYLNLVSLNNKFIRE
jgi:hypothetical protein